MSTIYRYRLWCNTHSTWEFAWGESTPNSGSDHAYDDAKTAIVETREPNIVKIEEESIATGGHYQAEGLNISVNAGIDVVSKAYWFDNIDNSILSIEWSTSADHTGDLMSAYAGKDETIAGSGIAGVLTADTVAPVAWSAQNYVAGDVVLYTHPNAIYGTPVYTCIQDTASNELPTNSAYWQRGFELAVSPAGILYFPKGFELSVSNGITTDHLGEIIFVDRVNNMIYAENAPANNYIVGAYVRPYRCIVKNLYLGSPCTTTIGKDKIGGAHVIANTIVTVEYTNKSTNAKTLPVIIARLR